MEKERREKKNPNNERAGSDPQPAQISTHTLPLMRGSEIEDVFMESLNP